MFYIGNQPSTIIPPGTVSKPGLAIAGDTNTGIYSPAVDTIAFSEGGVEAMRIDSAGRVGIGTSAPDALLNVVANTATDAVRITQTGAGNALVVEDAANPDSTPFIVTTSGQVIVGNVNALGASGATPNVQVLGSTYAAVAVAQMRFVNSGSGGVDQGAANHVFVRARGTTASPTTVASGDELGAVSFQGRETSNVVEAARISAFVDGTPGSLDMPGRLVFATTPDGTNSPTERMRIDSAGNVGIGTTAPGALLNVVANTATDAFRITQTGTGNALVVEDAANPDSTPFVVDASGQVIQGYTANITSASFQANGANTFSGVRWNSGTQTGTAIILGRSRSATIGTNSIVLTGDNLGAINFSGDDGAAFIRAASISADVDLTPGTNDMPGRLVFSTTADGAAAPTERMRITSTGNVGIGTTAPGALLNVVANTATDAVRITQTGAGNALVVEDAANPDSTPFVVTADGNVAIGTTAATAKLDVVGTANLRSFEITATDNVCDQNFDANFIDYNVSGTDALTASKNHTAFRVDVDSTASGGTTVNEHLLRGVYATVDVGAAGVSQTVIGSQSVSRTLNTTGTVSDMYGAFNGANVDPGVGGTVSTAYGSINQAYAGGAGTIGTIYGSRNEAVVESSATAGVTNAFGTFNEIEIDGNTLTNAYATQSVINSDGGVTTNGFLYRGEYSISAPGTVTNAWGLHLSGSTKNYVAGQIQADAGTAAAPTFSQFTDTNTGIFFPAADTIAFAEGGVESMRIDSAGNVGIGTSAPTAMLDINSNTLRLRTAKTPASATATGNAGDIAWDADYIYVCTATNTWKRTALSTW